MRPFLPLDHFINTENYKDNRTLPKNSFDLLGPSLSQWLSTYLLELGVEDSPLVLGQCSSKAHLEGPIYVDKSASIEPFAYIKGPAYIGPNVEIRHGSYIRGNVFVGMNSVVGHTTEVKNSVFLTGAKAGHFAYIGDSILGCHVNLGAGTKLANLKLNNKTIRFKDVQTGKIVDSQLRKWGAILGDHAQTGCNAVLSPGSILYPKTAVMPSLHHYGTLVHKP